MIIEDNTAAAILRRVLIEMEVHGKSEDTRTGEVMSMREPLITVLDDPRNRVLMSPSRDPNPFFHYMEALWMLAGRDDLWIKQFNSNIAQYAEDDGHFHGAYGYRWKQHFGVDQIKRIIEILKTAPSSRQLVIEMWDANTDLGSGARDIPCNIAAILRVVNGSLNLYVLNRSNDVVWGMMGSNVVHFSILLELISTMSCIPMGKMYQISTNAHLYPQHFRLIKTAGDLGCPNRCIPMFTAGDGAYDSLQTDLEHLLYGRIDSGAYDHPTFSDVAIPMYRYYILKEKTLFDIKCDAWRSACLHWDRLHRRTHEQIG